MKQTIGTLFFRAVLLFPVFTLLQDYLSLINRLLFVILAVLLILLMGQHLSRRLAVICLILVGVYLAALLQSGRSLYNLNDMFYYPFAVIYLFFLAENVRKIPVFFQKSRKYVTAVLWLWTIIVVISVFITSSYVAASGGVYFTSLCHDFFRLGPCCLFIMTLALYAALIYNNNRFYFFTAVPLACFFAGNSRTYLGIGLLTFFICLYYRIKNKTVLALLFVPLVILFAVLVWNSAIGGKILSTAYTSSSYFDFWGTVTSGRSVFWLADLKAYGQLPLWQKLFGTGFNYVYQVNREAIGTYIWAHNDFIQILLEYGAAGLILYLAAVRAQLRGLKKCRIFPAVCVVGIWLINAMFNMFYTYFCSILIFPILISAVRLGEQKMFMIQGEHRYENRRHRTML